MTQKELAIRLAALSAELAEIGAAMDYYGGMNQTPLQRGHWLISVASEVQQWADEMIDQSR